MNDVAIKKQETPTTEDTLKMASGGEINGQSQETDE